MIDYVQHKIFGEQNYFQLDKKIFWRKNVILYFKEKFWYQVLIKLWYLRHFLHSYWLISTLKKLNTTFLCVTMIYNVWV